MAATSVSGSVIPLDVKIFRPARSTRRGNKSRQRGAKADALDAQMEQGQENSHSLLLVPADIKRKGQFVIEYQPTISSTLRSLVVDAMPSYKIPYFLFFHPKDAA